MNAKDLVELIKARRSVRSFQPRPVPDELLEELVEAALWAPRAGNRQHWRIVAVRDQALKSRLAEAVRREVARQRSFIKSGRALSQFDAYTAHFTHFEQAPVVLVLVCRPYDSIYVRIVSRVPEVSMGPDFEPGLASTLMAAENLLLAAAAHGLGACFLSGPLVAHREIARLLELEEKERPAGFIALGFPAEQAEDTHLRHEHPRDLLLYR